MKKNGVLILFLYLLFPLAACCQSLWKEIPLPVSGSQYSMIDFSDSLSGWIFTSDGIYLRTGDGGRSWIKDWLGAPHSIKQIKAVSTSECWLVYSDTFPKVTILKTEDGTNWKEIPIPDSLNNARGKLEFASPATIWLPSRQGIFISMDYGKSWQKRLGPWGVGCNIDFRDSLNGLIAFWDSGPGGETYGTTLSSKNGGMSWDTLSYKSSSSLIKIKYYNANYGYSISKRAMAYDMPNYEYLGLFNGVSTINFTAGNVAPSSVIGGLYYLNGENFVVTSYHRMKRLSGDTTHYILSSGSEGLAVVAFEAIPERWNWILTTANHLYQSVDIPTAVDHTSDARITLSTLDQNYPNPFNPSTRISFSLPSRSFVTLKIFDVMGREVATLASEEMPAGISSRQWNASGMPSGVYFYRLQAGNYTETKKLSLVK
jgi:hypothetical protein